MKQVPFQYSLESNPVLAASEIRSFQIRTQADSFFVVRSIIGSVGQNTKIMIQDDASGRSWCSDPNGVRDTILLGTAQRPYWLTEPIVIPPVSSINVTLTNLSAVATDLVQIAFDGFKSFDLANQPLPEQKTGAGGQRKRWFQYVVNKVLGAGNRETETIKIQADSFFVAQEVLAASTGNFRVKITDSGSGRNWSDGFIRRDNYFGTAQYPKRLQPPTRINPSATVQFEFEDLSGNSNTIQAVLSGYKTFVN